MLQLLKLGQIVDETHNHIVDTYVWTIPWLFVL